RTDPRAHVSGRAGSAPLAPRRAARSLVDAPQAEGRHPGLEGAFRDAREQGGRGAQGGLTGRGSSRGGSFPVLDLVPILPACPSHRPASPPAPVPSASIP